MARRLCAFPAPAAAMTLIVPATVSTKANGKLSRYPVFRAVTRRPGKFPAMDDSALVGGIKVPRGLEIRGVMPSCGFARVCVLQSHERPAVAQQSRRTT